MDNDRPKILFIAPLPPPIHGSAVVSQQIRESKKINESFCCNWVNLSTSRKMDEIGKTTFEKPFRFLGALFRTLWLLMTRRYDLCYLAITCHGSGFLKDAPFVLLCKLFGNKIVIHQHNKGMSKDVNRWPYRWLLPMVYKKTKVVLLSWHLYSDIEKVVPKDNVLICPNGISVQKNEVLNVKRDNKVSRLLFLSNLMESKGVLVLLDALEIIRMKGYTFICNFVGGETKEIDAKCFAEAVGKRELNQNVFYLGRKYGDEKKEIYCSSDVFVFPTNEDCFPLVILEAMSYHLPIVTTSEGAIPDEVTDGVNGFICEKKNPDNLADCIIRLLDDEDLRHRMGEQGLKQLNNYFTLEKFEKKIVECLGKALN